LRRSEKKERVCHPGCFLVKTSKVRRCGEIEGNGFGTKVVRNRYGIRIRESGVPGKDDGGLLGHDISCPYGRWVQVEVEWVQFGTEDEGLWGDCSKLFAEYI
jgi:hypothetical protein